MAATALTLVDSTPLLDDPAALRARADEDGFLFLRGFLPRESVLDLRRQIVEVLDRIGVVDRSFPLVDGVADPAGIAALAAEDCAFCGVGVPRDTYFAVQQLEAFHRLPHHPRLIGLYEQLFGTAVLPHPRHICRMMLPGPHSRPTPPHQDFTHVQGTPKFWTCWFPLGDCPVERGVLSMLRGSHRLGLLPVKRAEGAGGLESWLCDCGLDWAIGDLQAGDILTFPCHTVHQSVPNTENRYIRLSLDCRYQPANEPIEARALQVHCNMCDWDEIYRDWQATDLQYYWQRHDLTMSPWDSTIVTTKDKIC